MDFKVGQTLDGRWVLRRVVARSEDATVFEATHAFLDRVASIVVAEPADREKLLEEAAARDRTYHPGILGVLDVADTKEGIPYLAAAPFTGRSLDGLLIARGLFSPDEAVAIIIGLGEALCHMHALGMAHAALSPSCVLVDGHKARLLDLGIFPTPLSALTGPLASMPYVAPERLRSGGGANRQTDVYAVAAMLAEMLSGEAPEEWPPDELSFPAPLAAVVDRGLDEPQRRFDSMEAFVEAVRRAEEGGELRSTLPPSRRRRSKRAAYVSATRLRLPNGTLDGRTENVSEGGMMVVGTGPVEVDDAVIARLALPKSGRIASEPGTVRWVRGSGVGARAFGVSFDDPADRTVEDIRAYVELFTDQE